MRAASISSSSTGRGSDGPAREPRCIRRAASDRGAAFRFLPVRRVPRRPRVVHHASIVLTAIAMSDKPQPRPRDAYRHFLPITTRWMDNDVYGHVNNVVYYSYFDTVVN
ncbi:acyl-CoA thioesterase, partial [Burkholderia contaminans]